MRRSRGLGDVYKRQVPYLVENMSWIVGSVGTIFLDGIVFYQFVRYAPERAALEAASYP